MGEFHAAVGELDADLPSIRRVLHPADQAGGFHPLGGLGRGRDLDVQYLRELRDRERAEEQVLARYLPAQLSDDELAEIVRQALAGGGFSAMAQMGPAMKAVQAAVSAIEAFNS